MTKDQAIPVSESLTSLAGEVAEMFSFNRSLGQIFMCLYLSADPMSLEDVALGCRMSKGNASLNLRTLEGWGAVQRSWQAGTRKDYYTASGDLRALVLRRLQEGLTKRLTYAKDRLRAVQKDPALRGAEGGHQARRMAEIDSLIGQAESLMAFLPKALGVARLLGKGKR